MYFSQVYLKNIHEDGADSVKGQLFFKDAYFLEHILVAMTIKTLEGMRILTEIDTGNHLYMFSSVFRTLLNIYG